MEGKNASHSSRMKAQQRVAANLTLGNELRRQVSTSVAIGTFLIEHPSPAAVLALAIAGFDFVVLDMEHSGFGFERLEALIMAAHSVQLPAIVRPWNPEPAIIGKVLDLGANGIMAPHVNSVDEAQQVVNACRYGDGGRGFSPLAKYGSLENPTVALNDACYVIVQLEGQAGMAQAQDIAAVAGIDAVFVGPYDLALSLGVETGDPKVAQAAATLARQVESNVSLGRYVHDPNESKMWAAAGFRVQCVSFDGAMLAGAARNVVQTARN